MFGTRKLIAVLSLGAALAAMPASAQTIDSIYTVHDYEKCQVITNEDPVIERLCEGHAGIPVRWLNGPDSSAIFFGHEVDEDTYDERFAFAVVQSTIEWRGVKHGEQIQPFAAIVRFQLCRAIGGPCQPELVVFRIEGRTRSCIAATVDARRTDANVRARALADSFVQNFHCGKDQRRPPE